MPVYESRMFYKSCCCILLRRLRRSFYGLRHSTTTKQAGVGSGGDAGRNQQQQPLYNVIVVGGGHAGVEAACAAARMGCRTALVTHKRTTLGEMSCNPSFGGIGKGHLMREIDALDGVCGVVCDNSGLQYRILNRGRGPAVWGYRAQIDRALFKKNMQHYLNNYAPNNLTIIEAAVDDLVLSHNNPDITESTPSPPRCLGLVTSEGTFMTSDCVVITTGTFLSGEIHIGLQRWPAGRIGDKPSMKLAASLKHAGFRMSRLKTGTPPRLDAKTIDYSRTQAVAGDNVPLPFSFLNKNVWLKPAQQLHTYLTFTNQAVNQHVHKSLDENIHVKEETRGPRYCPSLESKVLRFGHLSHRVWLEPEGFDSDVMYPQGMSMTMPEEYQQKIIDCIAGLEHAKIVRPGYGVEYDCVDSRQLKPTLETKPIQNLFLAGQINGTTGYEEAAAQGIIAGINAACNAQQKPPFILSRTEAYIGVMIDDLTTHGTSEPYRIFTSRAEHRILLRPDNADSRLTERARACGAVRDERWTHFCSTQAQFNAMVDALRSVTFTWREWGELLKSFSDEKNSVGEEVWTSLENPTNAVTPDGKKFTLSTSNAKVNAFDVLKTPYVRVRSVLRALLDRNSKVATLARELIESDDAASEQMRVRLQAHSIYEIAAKQQQGLLQCVQRSDAIPLPVDIDYFDKNLNISLESRERLAGAQPVTFGSASRLHGISVDTLLALKYYVDTNSNKTLQRDKRKVAVV